MAVIQFLLDEHVPHAFARGLRIRGVAVATATETGLLSVDDDLIVEFALDQGYVVFTQDDDYLGIAGRGKEHAGIVYCKQETRSIGEIVAHLEIISACLEPEDMKGSVEYL